LHFGQTKYITICVSAVASSVIAIAMVWVLLLWCQCRY